jgi:hypothetical protein
MNYLATEFRNRSEGLTQAANNLLLATDLSDVASALFPDNPGVATKFVSLVNSRVAAIIGKVNAAMYSSLADLLEYQDEQRSSSSRDNQLKSVTDRISAARRAAAKGSATGDWSDFDKFVAATGGIPTEEGSGGTEVDTGG